MLLFRLSNLGAFIFEFTLDAVIIKSAVVFAPIRYANFACHFKLYSLGLWYFWKIWIFSFQLMYLRMQNLRVINQKLNL